MKNVAALIYIISLDLELKKTFEDFGLGEVVMGISSLFFDTAWT